VWCVRARVCVVCARARMFVSVCVCACEGVRVCVRERSCVQEVINTLLDKIIHCGV
jgi:hypothetical protein